MSVKNLHIEELLVAVAKPAAHEDSPERKAAWDEIKRREAHREALLERLRVIKCYAVIS